MLADIEIYENLFAAKTIGFLNSYVGASREQIMQQKRPMRMLGGEKPLELLEQKVRKKYRPASSKK